MLKCDCGKEATGRCTYVNCMIPLCDRHSYRNGLCGECDAKFYQDEEPYEMDYPDEEDD